MCRAPEGGAGPLESSRTSRTTRRSREAARAAFNLGNCLQRSLGLPSATRGFAAEIASDPGRARWTGLDRGVHSRSGASSTMR
jgi:hypothetical protein